ncbi:hypothetical protein [Pseudomonas sp. RC2C2]|uniref:hypothetical protein n=1 Tax=Pseudomonas sp. RC2C2 TaxID=2834408 RepID=UPI001BD0E6A9|nr:hypothetical protein [Pseudomonas sp. RC2C2]MBS7601075.1 hypothetical protein [Pseudomonas sp. RC2C2]
MAWYRTGTVAITAGQTVVTGSGTNFPANSRVGDEFQGPDGRGYEIVNVTSETVLSILPAYMGPSVSGAAYGIKPINGYAKDLLDRINNLLLDFGGTLALFGDATDVPTLRSNISAAASGGNSDITALYGMTTALSLEQGGTGGKTAAAARTGLGLKRAAVADIVGAVSQSAGIPTGAIMEQGSAGGPTNRFIKYADGTMVCYYYLDLGEVAPNAVNGGTWYFPAVFAAGPVVSVTAGTVGGGGYDINAGLGDVPSTSAASVAARNSNLTSKYVYLSLTAYGRWF